MLLKGNNLIIMADGVAIAASKSCSIEVDVETIPVSSATDSEWEHSITGRKSWKVTTSHLLMSAAAMLMKVGDIVTLQARVEGNGQPFDGMVDNPDVEQIGTSSTPTAIYWDTTRKIFLARAGLTPKYYMAWPGSEEYSVADGNLFTYSGDCYVTIGGDLVKDVLQGQAICKTANITATVGNLAQGSFSWKGNGPFTTPATSST